MKFGEKPHIFGLPWIAKISKIFNRFIYIWVALLKAFLGQLELRFYFKCSKSYEDLRPKTKVFKQTDVRLANKTCYILLNYVACQYQPLRTLIYRVSQKKYTKLIKRNLKLIALTINMQLFLRF